MMRNRTADLLQGIVFLFLAQACCEPMKPQPAVPPLPVKPLAPIKTLSAEIAPFDGYHRLTQSIVPLAYNLDLTIDPAMDHFFGTAEIWLRIDEPTTTVQLHAQGMTFSEVSAQTDGRNVAAQPVQGDNGGVTLIFHHPLARGETTLKLQYRAPIEQTFGGIFRVKVDETWYVFTQLEPLDARRLFPCFDEPKFKTPYSLTLRVPKGYKALGNTPERLLESTESTDVYALAKSKPIPSYLVALAVGPFDLVPVKRGNVEVPIRIVTTQGRANETEFAVHYTPLLIKAMEEYFAQPFPYAKVDLVAVPNFGVGAMENVGLITFGEHYLLVDEATSSPNHLISAFTLLSHELGHMWFGNSVTISWWDDLWLNEGLTSWIETAMLHQIQSEGEYNQYAVMRGQRVMQMDAKAHTRPVIRPVNHGGEVFNSFNWVTYNKGRAIVQMMEGWVGQAPFRQGLRNYVAKYAHGTTSTRRFLDELDQATGKPVTAMSEMFLTQPGLPLVSATPTCSKAGVTLTLAQTRYLPTGSTADPGELWQLPVCVRYAVNNKTSKECFFLDQAEKTFTLATRRCPTWLHPNADELGYYRWKLPVKDLSQLIRRHQNQLTPTERSALPNHLLALLEAGELDIKTFLDSLEQLAKNKDNYLVLGIVSSLQRVYRTGVDQKIDRHFAAYVRRLLQKHLRRIGTSRQPEEMAAQILLRSRLIIGLAKMGQDQQLRKQAERFTENLFANPDGTDLSMAEIWLEIAAWEGDIVLWQKLKELVANTKQPKIRHAAVRALGSFDNPELLKKSMDLLWDRTLRAEDFIAITGIFSEQPAPAPAIWEWVAENYDRIPSVVGGFISNRLPWLAGGYCGKAEKDQLQAFFATKEKSAPNAKQIFPLVAEAIDRCVQLKTETSAPLVSYFKVK